MATVHRNRDLLSTTSRRGVASLGVAIVAVLTLTACLTPDFTIRGGGVGDIDVDGSHGDDDASAIKDDEQDEDSAHGGRGGLDYLSVGTIEVKVERGGAPPTLLTFPARECHVGADGIRAHGETTADGFAASIVVDALPRELLHSGTGTWDANGSAVVTIGDEVFTSDGRMIHVGDYPTRSVFLYRIDGNYAEFRTAWWPSGAAQIETAGFVHITCE